MIKSAISILQEIAQINKENVTYLCTTDSATNQFSYTCSYKGNSASGSALTKKDAKHLSAQNLLNKLGINSCITPPNPSKTNFGLTCNYIGEIKEYCEKERLQLSFDDLGYIENGFTFKCNVQHLIDKTKKFSVEGNGSTKKEAKHNSAYKMKNMLNLKPELVSSDVALGVNELLINEPDIIQQSLQDKVLQSVNYTTARNPVSILNEYCAKYGYTMPQYLELGQVGNQFCYQCRHQSFVTQGHSITKKMAKVESAEKMIKLIKPNDPKNEPRDEIMDIDSMSLKGELSTVDLIDLYDTKSIKSKLTNMAAPSDSLSPIKKAVKTFSKSEIELLQTKVESKGIEYKIHQIQTNPFILSLSAQISGNNVTLMEMADSYDEALVDLLNKLIANY